MEQTKYIDDNSIVFFSTFSRQKCIM